MQITGIEFQKKHDDRANLYIDGDFYCGVSVELILREQLKKGLEIDEQKLQNLILEDEKKTAFAKVLKYISSTIKTEKQIRDYLKRKEYSLSTIDHVINKLREYNYIDDEQFARSFVLTYASKYGKLKLISALRSKGVSENVIDNVFSEDLKIESNIMQVAEKYLKNKEKSPQTFMKLSRFLFSRGYEFDEINRTVNELKRN